MKTLVAYYSLEGNTALVANAIAQALGADVLKLETVKPFPTSGFKKFFIGGMSVVLKRKPALKNGTVDMKKYDNIILGSPMWAGAFASPINSFIAQNAISDKTVALFVCRGGSDTEKCFAKIKQALPGNTFAGEISFIDPAAKDSEKAVSDAKAWAEKLSLK